MTAKFRRMTVVQDMTVILFFVYGCTVLVTGRRRAAPVSGCFVFCSGGSCRHHYILRGGLQLSRDHHCVSRGGLQLSRDHHCISRSRLHLSARRSTGPSVEGKNVSDSLCCLAGLC